MHKESSFRDLDWDPKKLEDLGLNFILFPNDYCCFVAKNSFGGIIGFIIGMINEFYFGHDLVAEDLLLYVPQNKRGGKAAIRLVRAYEEWATAKGARRIMLGVSTEINTEQVVRLYERLGYKQFGRILKKGV